MALQLAENIVIILTMHEKVYNIYLDKNYIVLNGYKIQISYKLIMILFELKLEDK